MSFGGVLIWILGLVLVGMGVFGYTAHASRLNSISLLSVDGFPKYCVFQSDANANRSAGGAKIKYLDWSESAFEWDSVMQRFIGMDRERLPLVVDSIQSELEWIGQPFYPGLSNNLICRNSSTVDKFWYQCHKFSRNNVVIGIARKPYREARSKAFTLNNDLFQRGLGSLSSRAGLFRESHQGEEQSPYRYSIGPSENQVGQVPTWMVPFGIFCVGCGLLGISRSDGRTTTILAWGCGVMGVLLILTGYKNGNSQQKHEPKEVLEHNSVIVPQKYLDTTHFLGYSNYIEAGMANVLNTDKKIAVIGALAEGSSIRSIERITGVHRDTIMRLGVSVGKGCTAMMDAKMRNLPCKRLEMDEIWGFVGKKDRNVKMGDSMEVGSVWTFCAIDSDTKLVPAFKVGHRDPATTQAFVKDVAGRMANRVQVSTDGLKAYVTAMDKAFGTEVDYAQIIKVYGNDQVDNHRYSPPSGVQSAHKLIWTGNPNEDLISTSYIERLNATTRLHMRRLTRLTLAFSKKHENFVAAVGLHFAYYNFVKRHNTLRMTPAMASGVSGTQWSMGDLVEATA